MSAVNLNIRRDVNDRFYRYKMERLLAKVEGKGNGIKTVIVNLSNVAQQLHRPPNYLIKYFGFELGAQTNIDPKDDRWIINGAHEASKLQDHLDGFINKFVLCGSCKNPETIVNVKDGLISLDCKACGAHSNVDLRLKLSGFIIKDQPKKGKKDKSTKKADRKARKEAERNGGDDSVKASANGSPGDSASDDNEGNGDVEIEDGSDDEMTRRINAQAKNLDSDEEKEVTWTVDTSEAAVRARLENLPDDLRRTAIADDDDEGDGEGGPYDQLGKWIIASAQEKGGVSSVEDVEIYRKAIELGIEEKRKTLTVLAQTIFDEKIIKQIDKRSSLIKQIIAAGRPSTDRHEKAFLGGVERFVGLEKPELVSQVSGILVKLYNNEVISEEVLKNWCTKASKKYVDIATSKKVRKSAEKFAVWLETAESEDESEEDDD